MNICRRGGGTLRVLHPSIKVNEISKRIELHTNHQGFLFNREQLNKNPFDTSFRFAADTDLIDRLTNLGGVRVVQTVIANFYINGQSSRHFRKVLSEIHQVRPQKLSFSLVFAREWTSFKTLLRRFVY